MHNKMNPPNDIFSSDRLEQISKMKDTPDQRAWLKIERKLDRRKYRNRISLYRNVAVAAVMLFLVCFTILFSLSIDNNSEIENTTSLITSDPFSIQDLKSDLDPFYSSIKIKELNNSYVKSLGQFNFEATQSKQIL